MMVSVIITTHKREPATLKRAIDSVINQTYNDTEIFVIDDAPDYELHHDIVELVKGYSGKVRYHINTRKPGACASRNDGINMSQGDIIALLDDDDEWLQNKLDLLVPLLKQNVGLAYGRYVTINKKGNILINHTMIPHSGNVHDELFREGNFIGGCSVPVMLRKSIVDAGMFDEDLKSAQDYDLWIRIAKRYDVAYLDMPVVNYYISGDAISSSPIRKLESRERLLIKYSNEYERIPGARRRIIGDTVYYLCANGSTKEAKKYYKRNNGISFSEYILLQIKGRLKYFLLRSKLQNR